MEIQHLTLAVRGRRALARDEGEWRELVRALVGRGASRLLLFAVVDDHLHAVLRALRAGYLARDLVGVVRARRPDLRLKPAHLEWVDTRAYLSSLVRYVLVQPEKHGLAVHPALWVGSCFADLAGARLLPGFDPGGLLQELPRFRLREAFATVGLEPTPLRPASDEELRATGAARLVDLAAGVFGVGPNLSAGGRTPVEVEARALAVQAGLGAGLPLGELAHYLGRSRDSIRRLAARPLRPRALDALRRRLTLEDRARATPPLARKFG